MIVSHTHRFIFIKTQKSASTSIEIVLSSLCGGEDVVTPISPDDELAFRPGKGPQNYLKGDCARVLRADGFWKPSREYDFYNHMPASRVLELIGDKIWASYFKFAFVRNPWDRQVSLFHYHRHKRGDRVSFIDWLGRTPLLPCWDMITLAGVVALDFVGRYESLNSDFSEAMRRVGMSAPALPRAKADLRPGKHYREYYDEAAKGKVANGYAPEIEAFGYRF